MKPPLPGHTLRDLAYRYQPVLDFDESERSFPIRAEAWLRHVSSAAWSDLPFHDYRPDDRRRGTAILRGRLDSRPADPAAVEHLGGAPNPSERPIQISDRRDDPDAIGNPRHWDGYEDLFLSFAGWQPGSNASAGDPDYLYSVFSELSAVMNRRNCRWEVTDGFDNAPYLWSPQPPSPTVYVEAAWAEAYVTLRGSDFPEPTPGLERYLVLTYHMLYPQREPAPGSDVPARIEGQWEGISIYLPYQGPGDREPSPDAFGSPAYVVASQGPQVTSDAYNSDARRFDDQGLRITDGHVVIYVLPGTHVNAFTAPDGSIWVQPPSDAAGLGTPPPQMPGNGHLGGVGVLLGLGEELHKMVEQGQHELPDWWPPDPLLGLILGFLNWLFGHHDDGYGGDPNPGAVAPNPDAAPGPQAPLPSASEQGNTTVSATDDPLAGGYTNAGSSRGLDQVLTDIVLFNATGDAQVDMAPPPWWKYPGRWGVAIAPVANTRWRSGTRRVDGHGKSIGYWNTLNLIRASPRVWQG